MAPADRLAALLVAAIRANETLQEVELLPYPALQSSELRAEISALQQGIVDAQHNADNKQVLEKITANDPKVTELDWGPDLGDEVALLLAKALVRGASSADMAEMAHAGGNETIGNEVLSKIDVACNRFTNVGLEALFAAFQQCPALKSLSCLPNPTAVPPPPQIDPRASCRRRCRRRRLSPP